MLDLFVRYMYSETFCRLSCRHSFPAQQKMRMTMKQMMYLMMRTCGMTFKKRTRYKLMQLFPLAANDDCPALLIPSNWQLVMA